MMMTRMMMVVIIMMMMTMMVIDDDDDGLPAYSHQSYSHLVGICHNDEGWEYDTVTFPPCINSSSIHHFEGKCKAIGQIYINL